MGLLDQATDLNASDKAQGHLRNYTLDHLQRDVSEAGLRVVHQRGLFLKLVPNSLMLEWDPKLLWAINELAYARPHEAAEIFLVCESE
jgi:hypothetical protein